MLECFSFRKHLASQLGVLKMFLIQASFQNLNVNPIERQPHLINFL